MTIVDRLAAGRRGLSTMLMATILLIIIMIALAVFASQAQSYDQYMSINGGMTIFDTQKNGESVQLRYPGLASLSQVNNYAVLLDNNGAVSLDIARIYLYVRWGTSAGTVTVINPFTLGMTNNFFTNGHVDPGDGNHSITLITSTSISFQNSDPPKYSLILVTLRGNAFSFVLPIPTSPLSAGNLGSFVTLGVIRLDFNSYVYYHCANPQCTPSFLGPASAMNMSSQDKLLVFNVKLQNVGVSDIKIDSNSYLLLVGQNGSTVAFYILDNRSTPSSPVAYTTQLTLKANPSNTLLGGPWSLLAFGVQSNATSNLMNAPGVQGYAVFIILHGTMLSSPSSTFAQTIPFESTKVS